LHVRIKTTGLKEIHFAYSGFTFNVVDVGGQKSERRKWVREREEGDHFFLISFQIHCFQDVTALLYVASLADYDLMMEEDNLTNRYADSVDMFEKVVNNKFFEAVNIVLFLNKKDIFKEKIKQKPMNATIKEFPKDLDPYSFKHCVKYVEGVYKEKDHIKGRTMYVHLTCATDTSNIEQVWNAVHEVMIKQQLQEIDGAQQFW